MDHLAMLLPALRNRLRHQIFRHRLLKFFLLTLQLTNPPLTKLNAGQIQLRCVPHQKNSAPAMADGSSPGWVSAGSPLANVMHGEQVVKQSKARDGIHLCSRERRRR
ncbi:hypothetical protein PVAP13_3KG126809 [Panicum virgatum]|uniref:Uncharacterized protein n=1 Tax=Panicum virgatum TaxID=38727 RepID=A0A8T0V245_PANVG|nr:hypothetical protein PVAP13_3KG126809 [Panicum virgatum]